MKIIKRDLREEVFTFNKIRDAIKKAFSACDEEIDGAHLKLIKKNISETFKNQDKITVEQVQDQVETELMKLAYYKVAKSYIIYREKRSEYRQVLQSFKDTIDDKDILKLLENIQGYYTDSVYNLELLRSKFQSFYKPGVNILDTLIKACVELVTAEAPNWEFIASSFLMLKLERVIVSQEDKIAASSFYDKIKWLTEHKFYGTYILENYTKEEVLELEEYLKPERNKLLTYSSLDMLSRRYLICNHNHEVMERPQEMFMGIAMHLSIPEGENKVHWAKKIYDILSKLKVTMATPTMSNSRKPLSQLSSCFEDVMPDNLIGIYRTLDNFAQVSKFGGGMGIYMGKVRAIGSDIRGFKNVAGGVLKWIKLCNDTAIAVDQLGVRQGSVAIYLDIWHKDMPDFLQIRTNNGDDRMKAHDVFPGLCIPDYFWQLAKDCMDAEWYMMCPHEIQTVKGYCLEDYWGDEWEEKYKECIADERISKRSMTVREMIRLILKSAIETGTPFIFNRDTVNRCNPNKNHGIIYCSNLCTEIAQNQREIETKEIYTKDVDGKLIVCNESIPGEFVVCNLASLVLGNINVNDNKELKEVVSTVVRALDNVIDLNFYPIPYARITNRKMRPIGLGTSGYHHMLVKNRIAWESQEHLDFVDKVYEKINFYAIEASNKLAKEKGRYDLFENSDWQTGEYFRMRNYNSSQWQSLQEKIKADGMRNGYLLAIAPTSSTSVIAGTTAGTDPVMNKFFLEEKKGSIVPRVAPELNAETMWLYKIAHNIGQEWVIKAAAIRQRHLDQAQSVNLFIDQSYKLSQLLNLYISAWESGLKTLYYVRSKSLEVEECESCSA